MRARAPGSRWRTTAGTGSETSWAYVITDTTTDPDNPHKYVAFDDASVTSLAVDDPVLYYDCPLDYTAQCGFDVLAHASEPYVSRLNFPPSLGNALYAIKLTSENLRAAVWNGQDLPGREGMMYAQYIAAQAFNSGGLGIIHSISHAVSAFYDLHHGLNNAVALPRVWAFNMPVAYQRFADIAYQMGVDTHGMTAVQAAEAALAAAIRLLRDVGIPEKFTDVTQDSYSKNRLGKGPTKFYENAKTITGDRLGVLVVLRRSLAEAVLGVAVLGHIGELLRDAHVPQQPDGRGQCRLGGLHGGHAVRVQAHHVGDVGEPLVGHRHVERPHPRQRDGVVQPVVSVVEGADRVRDRVDDAKPAGVERLRGDVLGVHHALAAGQVLAVPHRRAEVLRGQLDGVQRVAQRRREVQPGHVRLGSVREHIEAALGGVVKRAVVVQHRVVDSQAGHAGVIERHVLVRLIRVSSGVGDDIGPGGLRTGARRRGDGDVRRI